MNKSYHVISLLDNSDILDGYVGKYSIPEDILADLSKYLGISYDTYVTISSLDKSSGHQLIRSLSTKNDIRDLCILTDEDTSTMLGFTYGDTREPILNDEFISRVSTIISTCDELEVVDTYIVDTETQAMMLIKKKTPLLVDQGSRKYTYTTGVLMINDELDGAFCRLVIFLDGQPYYVPSSFYNASTNRYKKSTSSSVESLEVLALKVVDDLREDYMKYKLGDFYLRHSVNETINVTYEEYNTILRTMLKIPTIIEDQGLLEEVSQRLSNFESKYSHLEDQRSSYIWRCTAISDMTLGSLVNVVSKALSSIYAPLNEYYEIRDLIGYYLGTNRIATEIAKEG